MLKVCDFVEVNKVMCVGDFDCFVELVVCLCGCLLMDVVCGVMCDLFDVLLFEMVVVYVLFIYVVCLCNWLVVEYLCDFIGDLFDLLLGEVVVFVGLVYLCVGCV